MKIKGTSTEVKEVYVEVELEEVLDSLIFKYLKKVHKTQLKNSMHFNSEKGVLQEEPDNPRSGFWKECEKQDPDLIKLFKLKQDLIEIFEVLEEFKNE